MAYLTKSNANKIISGADLLTMELSGILYKKPIYFFNILEYKKLIAYYTLYKDPEHFLLKYIPIKIEDKMQFIWEGGTPAYHSKVNCEKVHSDFRNIKIPEQIQAYGEEAVSKFRNWFKQPEIINLFYDKEETFMMRMHLEFARYLPSRPEPINYTNSGQEHFNNFNLLDLENSIDSILEEFSQLVRVSNTVTRRVIVYYDKYTYYATKGIPFPENLSNPEKTIGIGEDSIRRFLKEFEKRYKNHVANLLKHYYRVKFNPELKFEGELLEQLGFRKCASCF